MLIVRDSQVKKLFYKEQEIDKILDWNGNVVFEKESAPVMTNDIKFHTNSSVSGFKNFIISYTDSTNNAIDYTEPNKQYTAQIPTDKTVESITFDSSLVDEIIVSCKINLSDNFFSTITPNTIRFLNCDSTASTSLSSVFTSRSKSVKLFEIRNLDARNATSMKMFFNNSKGIESIVMRDLNVSKVTDTSEMFSDCSGATTIDIANWDTSSLTQMKNMFVGCTNVTDLDLSSFNTSAVTSMYGVFDSCKKLSSIKLNGWNTSKVTSMDYMFYGCSSLTSLDLSRFDVSLVTSMMGIFEGCSSLTSLDLSSWKVGINLRNLDYAFRYCSSLTSLDISGWNLYISNISNMYAMFVDCKVLKTIYMRGCNKKTIDKIKKQLSFAKLYNVTIVTE